jgi:hypothetical protein
MSAMSFRRALSATLLVAGVSGVAGAQDCAPTPLLGRRIAVGANVSHSTLDETSLGASITGRVAGPLRLDGDYQSTRVADVDGLARGGRASLSAPLGFAGFALCPTAGVGYTRLSTTESSAEGRVTTRESRFGASLGRTFTFAGATSLTPFLEPLLVRQNVSCMVKVPTIKRSSGSAYQSRHRAAQLSHGSDRSAVTILAKLASVSSRRLASTEST